MNKGDQKSDGMKNTEAQRIQLDMQFLDASMLNNQVFERVPSTSLTISRTFFLRVDL